MRLHETDRHGGSWISGVRPERMPRVRLPEHAAVVGSSILDADRAVRASIRTDDVLDTTHFDTVRFPAPAWAADLLVEAAADGRTAYTNYRGSEHVLETLAGPISELLGTEIDPVGELALTPGTQGALFATLSATVGDGDRVALVDPDYLFSERILRFLGAEVDRIGLDASKLGATLDWEGLEAAFEGGARVLLFSHPNNPTGAVYSPESLARIAALARQHDVLVIVDQLYARLIYGDTTYTSPMAEPGMRERCISLIGPSKTESLTGYRTGVVAGPPQIIDRIEEVISLTSLRAPAYSQHVLEGWLTRDTAWVSERVDQLLQIRDLTVSRLRELPWLKVQPQQGTAYLFPDVSALGMSDVAIATRLVENAKVLVSPGYQFGPGGVGSFRICYARDERTWDAALDRMVDVLGTMADEAGLSRP